jgi:hypothetical protein
MSSELQRLVDDLGVRLGGRSVAIDDHRLRLLAYSAHAVEVDDLRMTSLLHRRVPRELRDYLRACGGFDRVDLFSNPPRPDLGARIRRIGMPIRDDRALLGFLWLLSTEGGVEGTDADEVRRAARQAADLIRAGEPAARRRAAASRHLRDLLSDDTARRETGVRRLLDDGHLVDSAVTVLVVGGPRDLRAALARATGRLRPRTAVHAMIDDSGVVLVAHPDPSTAESLAERLAADGCLVGVGESRTSLSAAHESSVEARRALGMARALGPVVHHDRLGVDRVLAELSPAALEAAVPEGLRALLAHETLVSTLEAFLRLAGDVPKVAADLNLHRSSVHYRLRRIEQIVGVDLADGEHRLRLHLGLRAARLLRPPS